MKRQLDSQWAEEVIAECSPVFKAADVGFVHQVILTDEKPRQVSGLLWEANPQLFADRYPKSGIIESYSADQWSRVSCIDFWIYIDHMQSCCRLSVEGWNLPDLWIELTGHGGHDGRAIAATMALILGVEQAG